MTKVKVCGITNIEDALMSVEFGADALGFVFAESKRKISIDVAREIIRKLPPFVTTVGVFVNSKKEDVEEVITECRLDAVQFHGEEEEGLCRYFSNMVKVIKTFRVKDEDSLSIIRNYESIDAVLLDTYVEGEPGGTGKSFDWKIALKAKGFGKPLILAGGINAENVEYAIFKVSPYCIDLSSGVETYPGKKDPVKLKILINKVKNLNNHG